MVNQQWFKLTNDLAEMANEWWDEVRVPYAKKVEEVVKKFGAETYYEIHLVDGRDRIIGLYFPDKIPPGWRKDSKYYNCSVPHRTTKLGMQYANIFKKIQNSPVTFKPIRKVLDLPPFWEVQKMKKIRFPHFYYLKEKGCFLGIPAPIAEKYANKYPDLEPVTSIEIERIKRVL